MAYDENGRYYFSPELDAEDAEALNNIDRMQAAAVYKRNQQVQRGGVSAMREGMSEALKEEGISEKDFQQLLQGDPQAITKDAKEIGKAIVQKRVQGARQRDNEGRFVKSGPTARPDSRPVDKKVTQLKEEGRQLSDDELVDVLGDTLKGFDL